MLRFNSDHKFKIMQIADTQEIPAARYAESHKQCA